MTDKLIACILMASLLVECVQRISVNSIVLDIIALVSGIIWEVQVIIQFRINMSVL